MTAGRRPHRFVRDPQTPGVCLRCLLIKANAVHDESRLAEVEAETHEAQDAARRRIGEED